jgi:hypothetical protein
MASGGGQYFQTDLPKAEGTPVYPLVRSRVELLKGLIAGYVLGEPEYVRLPEWGTPHPGLSLWERFVYACNLVSSESEGRAPDYGVYLRVYDAIHHTTTVELPGTKANDEASVSSIPVWDDPAVGFPPMLLGERVMYYDGAAWVPRWVADPRRKGDTVSLGLTGDEDADTEWVPMTHVLRQAPKPPQQQGAGVKTPPAASALLTGVEEVWQN